MNYDWFFTDENIFMHYLFAIVLIKKDYTKKEKGKKL